MEKGIVKYSPMAADDLEDVWQNVYEASGDQNIANHYVNGLMDEVAEKAAFPKSGIPLSYDGIFTGFYSVNYKMYKAFYRVKDGDIEVARIIMRKRDYMKILFEE